MRLLSKFMNYVSIPKDTCTYEHKLLDMQYVNPNMNLFKQPETYRTLLKHEYGQNGVTVNTKKKMNMLISDGVISSDNLNNSTHRELIFFVYEKEYTVVITRDSVYYCNTIVPQKDCSTLTEAFELTDYEWRYVWNVQIKTGDIVKCF